MNDIITIGSITRDNFLEADYEIVNWPKAQSGKALALPFGEKLEVKRVYSTIGGNSANASVTFARQGFKTACFGKVGNDLSGKEITARLKSEKVSPFFAFSKDRPTAYSVLLLEKGERTILGYHGASDTMELSDIPWNKLKAKWWYLSLAGESDRFLKPLLAFARENKIKVAFNPSGHHIKHKRKEILDSLKDLSFLVLNESEAADLVGMDFKKEKEVFKKLDKLTPGIVAVTDGPNGVTVSDGKFLYKAERSAFSVQRSGKDNLTANRYTLNAIKFAIRLASANATSVVEQIGATEGILTKKQFQSPRWQDFKISVKKL